MTQDTITTQLYINGLARAASDGGTYPLHNPARPSELVGHVAAGTERDAEDAVQAAHRAFPAWSALSYAERAAQLNRVADLLVGDEAEVEARSRLFTREHGKIRRETLLEITRLGDRFRQTAAYAERLALDETLPGPPFDAIITRQPRGVAVLVVPWNWPLAILGAKLPQALMAGNTVVVKPSENAALATTLTLHMIAAALPAGVVNIVTGDSARIGDRLTGHPLTRFVNFTGSVAIGRHVMKVAAENLTPVTLELGGNDPGIVLKDAVLDEAAFNRLYMGAFMSTGQICMALKRLYVHRSRYDEVVAGITAVAARQVVGDGLLTETTMGPLNNPKQLGVVRGMIAEALAAGADVQEFGRVPDVDLYQAGYFQRPTFVLNADPQLRVVREEQFGPVLPIMAFDSEAEVIAVANNSEFGLCSSIWTADRDRAVAMARQLEAGFTYLNAHGPTAQDGRSPFGGFKNSGIGRNMGYEGVIQFQGHHAISGPAGWLL
ncbi:aldehyde dehydrogenase family protein [Comamonas thiooxydans]|uniref:Aldehyde dehydrogenase family protein n=1 Tax=Comamonas thiooxydans TaxID=363952 RepID=A0AA42TUJ8_9BURK|nr:aldehyde dehydrogenase family protein [Comamonas thiooxydans]MDH1334984.1 aldehyde dehydrogenase family protein [Comamonas thiooxydans]MDH1741135.1 aldehyde dehydrogenase family protein [Comamonas thiooxydans]MDH1787469.1 aldehyde dehydrogenase family protein [Comamonas thiooxydans]